MKARGNRDEIVLATKYTTMWDSSAKDKSNKIGNSYKSMFVSVEKSLQNLQTSYIDILYLHWYASCITLPKVSNVYCVVQANLYRALELQVGLVHLD